MQSNEIFSEIYSIYFNTVAAILKEAVSGNLTEKTMNQIIAEKGFTESILEITPALKNGEWQLLNGSLKTPLKHIPTMPLTLLQKKWLKTLLLDPRIALFGISCKKLDSDNGSPSNLIADLKDVAPLYWPETFVYFDRYSDGDPYTDRTYITCFQTIRSALKTRRKLKITFEGGKGGRITTVCIPYKLEYSEKDDKFRLLTAGPKETMTINVARMTECIISDPYALSECCLAEKPQDTITMVLSDSRNALERAMLHFSHFEKETERIDHDTYEIHLRYNREDETELIIRVLSFGPMITVTSPEPFIYLIRQRLQKQQHLTSEL